jgi:hypothetical protein
MASIPLLISVSHCFCEGDAKSSIGRSRMLAIKRARQYDEEVFNIIANDAQI